MRLFAAIRPPGPVLAHLAAALPDDVGPGGPPPLRWTPPEQRHVTLAFYGEVPDGALDELHARLAAVAASFAPFRLQLAGAGVFSGATLWIGVRAGADDRRLGTLLADCEGAGAGISRVEPRDRHRAHLTVARVGSRQRARRARSRTGRAAPEGGVDLDALVRALSVYRGPEWDAGEIELLASRLGEGRGGGPLHEVLATVALGPVGPVGAVAP